ncbi:MAG: hypothetical protein JSS04_13890 [Proteobacteria bacterium]|nr:hypothetical protein [Pseudomonadota bacterium]
MKSERTMDAWVDQERARREAFVRKPDDAATPQQKLVRAAESGRFETIVAAAQPAEPPKMVSPEEREAELRRTGKWPDEPEAKPKAAPNPEPKEPERPLTPPLTPGEAYIAEHCRWRARGPSDRRARVRYGRCLTEYDVLTGEIIGDGYDPRFDEDDAW